MVAAQSQMVRAKFLMLTPGHRVLRAANWETSQSEEQTLTRPDTVKPAAERICEGEQCLATGATLCYCDTSTLILATLFISSL